MNLSTSHTLRNIRECVRVMRTYGLEFCGSEATLVEHRSGKSVLQGCEDPPGCPCHLFRRNFHLPAEEVRPYPSSACNYDTWQDGKHPAARITGNPNVCLAMSKAKNKTR